MKPIPFLKLKLSETLLNKLPPLLCASIGRVASTAVQRAFEQQRSQAIFGRSNAFLRTLVGEKVWDVEGVRFRPGAVYKTHDFPYRITEVPRLKIVFLHGRPSDSVLSLIRCSGEYGTEWMERHFAHMHADGGYDELLQRDVLRLGEQLAAWSAVRNLDVLSMRYSTLWDHAAVLNKFVGFKVPLPVRRKRDFLDVNASIVAIARENYAELDKQESLLPDYSFSRPGCQCG